MVCCFVDKNLKATIIFDFPVCGSLYSKKGKQLEYFIEDEVFKGDDGDSLDFDSDLEEGYIVIPVNVYYKLRKLYTGQ